MKKMIEIYTKFIFQQYWYFNHLQNVGAFIGEAVEKVQFFCKNYVYQN